MAYSHPTHNFSNLPRAEIQRSQFDLSKRHSTMFWCGDLIPFYYEEVLPGDTFNMQVNLFARLVTPYVPFMDDLFMETFFFFVPLRLVWTNSKKMFGERVNPTDHISYSVPQVVAPAVHGFELDTIFDYLGLPTGVPGISVSACYHRSYNLIYNNWFRKTYLIDEVPVSLGDAADDYHDVRYIRRRAKRPDYFTSALPWPQRGTAIDVPFGGTAPVIGNGKALTWEDGSQFGHLSIQTGGTPGDAISLHVTGAVHNVGDAAESTSFTSSDKMLGVSGNAAYSGLIANLAGISGGPTISDLRRAFQWQRMQERDARGGCRYVELIHSHFGVVSPDARQQRPEILFTSSQRLNVNPVPQTGPDTGAGTSTSALTVGSLGAYIQGAGSGGRCVKSFTEHGIILGIVNIRAALTYQQGIDRQFSRQTRYDFYWPALAHLSEQEIKLKEIFAAGTAGAGADETTWGYQERYGEYRYGKSIITGQLRSPSGLSLDVWHLAEYFSTAPSLNEAFISDPTEYTVDRATAVKSQPQVYFNSWTKVIAARPMPVYSVPGLIDHF